MNNSNAFLNLLINVVFPTIILTQSENYLGVKEALIIALSLPLGYGLYDLIKSKRFNFLSLLGFISVLLTGAIGLFELDASMIAIKEAAIPLFIGLIIFGLKKTKYAFVENFIPKILDFDKINEHLNSDEDKKAFAGLLSKFNDFMAMTFFLSASLNFALAKYLVKAESGTQEFNQQIGEMTALSFPVITIPTSILFIVFIIYLFKKLHQLTSLGTEELILSHHQTQAKK